MEQSRVYIRYATAADATLLADMGRQTFYVTFAADNTPENMAAYLASAFGVDQQAAELADPANIFLIAEIDGVAVGYAKLEMSRPPAEITGRHAIEIARLYAARAWIGQGIGPLLMQRCLDEAQKRGADVIWLGVWEHNPRARAFYRKWGFVEVGTHVFNVGDDPQTDYLMQRHLMAG